MPIREHPVVGTLLMCDFNSGFKEPEMVKRRPVVVISPKISARPGLCTVVALSTTPPRPVQAFHREIKIEPPLPDWFRSEGVWIKGDMINAVGLHRLDFIRLGKSEDGRRLYRYEPVSCEILKIIRDCVLKGLGLSSLTNHL